MSEFVCDYRDAATSKNQAAAVDACVSALKLWGLDKFDAIAWTGNSGAMVAPVVAYLLGKHQLPIRKPGQPSHVSARVDWPSGEVGRYIIIDDFIASGGTILYIVNTLTRVIHGVCVGVLQYTPLTGSDRDATNPPLNITNINTEVSHA